MGLSELSSHLVSNLDVYPGSKFYVKVCGLFKVSY